MVERQTAGIKARKFAAPLAADNEGPTPSVLCMQAAADLPSGQPKALAPTAHSRPKAPTSDLPQMRIVIKRPPRPLSDWRHQGSDPACNFPSKSLRCAAVK